MTRVVVTFPLEAEHVERLRRSRLNIDVQVLGDMSRLRPGERLPFGELQSLTTRRELEEALPTAEIVLCPWGSLFRQQPGLVELLGNVRWIQSVTAGAERVPSELLQAGVQFTTASGVAAIPIAEYALTYMLMWSKGWPRQYEVQRAREWRRAMPPRELFGRTVGIIGMGSIGTEVARRAKAFGCLVLGMRRSFTARGPDEVADEAIPPADLDYLLRESDFVVLAAPLTPETSGLIGAAALRAMKPTALLINIARGQLIDEAALVSALKGEEIGGAALDVFVTEPLPQESELWTLPNVIITPHSSSATEVYMSRVVDIFLENLSAFSRGEALTNTLNPGQGY